MANNETPTVAVPGTKLGYVGKHLAGPGTYVEDGVIYSSLLGKVSVEKPEGSASLPSTRRLTKITAAPQQTPPAASTISVCRHARKRELLPEVDNIVLCRVIRLMTRQAIVSIQQVQDTVLQTEWQGVIRVQDVRATEKDKVKIHESFKPNDIVRAQVISLGDQANYYLSTASNELGVIMAVSEDGNDMVPISWKEFKDPETGAIEHRKVAKPR